MLEYLESRADKFTFRVATDRYYTPEGVWVLPESPTRVRLGFTDFLQLRSGDIAAITAQPTGAHLEVGDSFAELETVKLRIPAKPIGHSGRCRSPVPARRSPGA